MPTIPVEEERKGRFEAVYLDHHASIYAYVHRRLVGMGGDVHDVVAEVFEVAWRRLDELPEPPQDRLWLFGVARRCVLRAHRSGRRRRRLQARLADEAGVLADGQTSDERGAVVRAAIERLPPHEREVVQLVMWDGLTYAEAARVLGCSPNAVAVRLHKARKRLQAELGTSEGEEW